MLHVVVERCDFAPDLSRGTVVVQSDLEGPPFTEAFEELNSTEARACAQRHGAEQGMGRPHINGNVQGPYPVNADGVPLDEVKEGGRSLPQTHPKMQPKWYRVEVPLATPLR